MSNGGQAPAKKGIPVWAWIGIGCAAMVILVLIVVMVGGFFVARKVQDVAADFEANPAMATAKMIVKLNPELEEVSNLNVGLRVAADWTSMQMMGLAPSAFAGVDYLSASGDSGSNTTMVPMAGIGLIGQ